MQKLEKILERLGAYICDELCCHRDIGADKGEYAMQEICEKCELGGYLDDIRKRLSCENNSEITRLSQDNGGWIPVNERLPENERSVLMCGDTGCIDVGWWNGKRWKTGFSHADNFEAVAWRPLPNPYRPASKTPEEMQEWKERMLRNFLRGHKTIRG